METVKNQGRQDVKDKWQAIENKWVEIIKKQTGDKTVQWLKPQAHLSYQMPEKPFKICEEDFIKTIMDYLMFKEGIDVKEFNESLMRKVLYNSAIEKRNKDVFITLRGDENE